MPISFWFTRKLPVQVPLFCFIYEKKQQKIHFRVCNVFIIAMFIAHIYNSRKNFTFGQK